jgi:hypothetical protein
VESRGGSGGFRKLNLNLNMIGGIRWNRERKCKRMQTANRGSLTGNPSALNQGKLK